MVAVAAFHPSQRGNSHENDAANKPTDLIANQVCCSYKSNMPAVEQFSQGRGWYMMATNTNKGY
jgi:hypothetical protein